MKRVVLAAACLAAALALGGAAGAQAIPFWEVKGPPGSTSFHLLPEGVSETLRGTVAMSVTGGTGTVTEFKDACSGGSLETIENPKVALEGIDEMLEFGVSCPLNGSGPFPCVSEPYVMQAVGFWPSELFGLKGDIFEKVELQVTCVSSGMQANYRPPGKVWLGQHATAVQKFAFQPGAPFKHLNHWFDLWGTIKLKPLVYVSVR